MPLDELTISQWSLLDRRLIWAYSGAPAACFREMYAKQAFYVSAKCFLSGYGDYTIDGTTRRCRTGEWLFMPPGAPFHQRLSNDASHLSLRFRLHWPSGLPLFDHDRVIIAPAADFPSFTTLGTRLCIKRRDSGPDPTGAHGQYSLTLSRYLANELLFQKWIIAYGEVMQAFGVAPQPMPKIDPRLLNSIRLAESDIRRGTVSVTGLARQSGLTENHLGRLFREAFGVPPSEFINQRRLQAVIQAVEHEHQSLKEVAFSFGFGSPQHFSRWFKRMTGHPPRSYFR